MHFKSVILQPKTKQKKHRKMKNTNPIFSLKNFRSFGEEGADFELAPITVLTGCNSAGKSSLVKAQLLLEPVLKEIVKGKGSSDLELHVSGKELMLGRFSKIINNNATNGRVSFSYVVFSNFLYEKVRVTLEFVKKNDVVDNGDLSSICIEKLDGTPIFKGDGTPLPLSAVCLQQLRSSFLDSFVSGRNYLTVLDNYRRFALIGILEHSLLRIETGWDEEDVSIWESQRDKALKYCKEYGFHKAEILAYESTKQLNIVPNFETVMGWIETGTMFFYLPIFEAVKGKEKRYVREYLLNEIASENQERKKAVEWVNHFADDFEKSEYDSFLDYFIALEHNAMISGNFLNSQFYDDYHLLLDEEPDFKEGGVIKKTLPTEMSRKEYEEKWSFMAVVKAISDICFHGELDLMTMPGVSLTYINDAINKMDMSDGLVRFFDKLLSEALSPQFLEKVKYVNSSSVAIKRLYSPEDNDKIGVCIKQYLKGKQQKYHFLTAIPSEKEKKKMSEYCQGMFMNKWIQLFGIGDGIKIKGTEEGLGVLVYLEKGGEEVLLADEGYGITQLVALLLQVENNILNAELRSDEKKERVERDLQYVPSTIYVEEPEVHLHPKYQSLLADMFVEAYQKYNIHFIIETHSEYLIRKLQVLVADKGNNLTPNDVSLNYVEKDKNGISTNRKIEIREDGSLDGSLFGTGFYDEADSLAMELFRRKPILS